LPRQNFNRNRVCDGAQPGRNTAALQWRTHNRKPAMNTAAFADTLPARWSAGDAAPAASWIDGAAGLLARWLDASRSRQTLEDLDEHLLRDIGITRDEAQHEARKFFWQV